MLHVTSLEESEGDTDSQRVAADVAMLTSYVPPHQVASYAAWAQRMRKLTILVSTRMEKHRNWNIDWGNLDVRVQRTLTLQRPWKHNAGFSEDVSVHFPWDTFQQLNRLQPDLVISGELGTRSLLSALYCKRRPSVPLVLWACVSEHTEFGRGWLRDKLRRWLVNQADCIIVNGASGRRYIASLGFPNEQIYEIPYTCPSEPFSQCSLQRSGATAKRLIYVGQLIERKGLHLFLPALVAWANSNPRQSVEMTIVGSGPLEEQLRAIPLPSNLRLDFAGWKPYEQLAAEYSQAGILVFPTLADEWGLVVNEAMSAAVPVLGSRYSAAVEELCDLGETGWIFRPDRQNEIHSALDLALNSSEEELNRMRLQCRERIAEISSERCANKLAEIMRLQLENKAR